jgi:glycerophosphodiester phosphodiesterase
MGMNMRHPDRPAAVPTYRENTVESFLRAADAGATFVEFDVQVTADGVPVLWHDDLVLWRRADGGVGSAQIADLTLAEFKRLLQRSAEGEPLLRSFHDAAGGFDPMPVEWRCAVDDRLPTLAEVFARVPEHVGFDIEVKMATPDSCPRTPQAEVDRMVNAVLGSMNYMANSRRRMMFSSFDPDVCAALRLRQQRIPVLFLSDGVVWHSDDRRNSVAAAVEVALAHQLQGVVLESGALRAQQGAAAAARRQGLQLMTFGLDNNDPAWVLQQHLRLGVAAAIVDDVSTVAAGLVDGLEFSASAAMN